MLSQRVALSRDLYAAGQITIAAGAGKAMFAPLNAPNAPTQSPPVPASAAPGTVFPVDVAPAIIADRIFLSNPGAHPIFVRPVIPGSAEAQEYDYPNYPNAQGGNAGTALWLGFSAVNFGAAPPTDGTKAITVPAGAIAFPIEIVCIGLVISGTNADVLDYAAYGTNMRA